MKRFLRHSRPTKIILYVTSLLAVPIVGLRNLFASMPLVYGDIPLTNPGVHTANPTALWATHTLGTNVRQGMNTLRDTLFMWLAPNSAVFYFLTHLLPLALIPLLYFYFLGAIGIKNNLARFTGATFAFINPVVFGDIITGQSFWPHLLVPLVFLVFVKIFIKGQFSIRNSMLFGSLLAITIGLFPPIAPVLGTVIIIMIITVLIRSNSFAMFKKIALVSSVSLAVFSIISLPYIFAAPVGSDTYTSSNVVSDYLHNYKDTTLDNTYRLAGNNGSGQKTLEYNQASHNNSVGFIFIIIAAFGLMITVKRNWRNRKSAENEILNTMFAFGIPLLIIIGFMHILSINTSIGENVFNSHWLFNTIRNPSKLYVIILPLFVFLLTRAIEILYNIRFKPTVKILIFFAMSSVVLIYGWPFLRGDMGLTHAKPGGLSKYAKDEDISVLSTSLSESKRAILIDANHQDELNYQNISPALNTLRLGGGFPKSNEAILALNTAYNTKSSYYLPLIKTLGIDTVILDRTSNESMRNFTLFNNSLDTNEADQFLGSGAQKITKSGKYNIYSYATSNPLIFSPTTIASLDTVNITDILPLISDGMTVINRPSMVSSDYSMANIPGPATKGYARVSNEHISKNNLSLTNKEDGSKILKIDTIDPYDPSYKQSQTIIAPPETNSVIVEDNIFQLNSEPQNIIMKSGPQTIELVQVDDHDSSAQFSGESIIVQDASSSRAGIPQIYGTYITGENSFDGLSYLLNSQNHKAYFSKKLYPNETSKYLLSFSYVNISGRQGSYTVYINNQFIEGRELYNSSTDWHKSQMLLDIKKDDVITVNFYTDSDGNKQSKNMFDDLRLYKVNSLLKERIYSPSPEPYREFQQGFAPPTIDTHPRDKVFGFEEGIDWEIGDASINAGGEALINAYVTEDAYEGSNALALETNNHTVYASKNISDINQNIIHKLSFYYKNISGERPSYGIVQKGETEESNIFGKCNDYSTQNEWTLCGVEFSPIDGAGDVIIYLYSKALGESTLNIFDSVTITPMPEIEKYLIFEQSSSITSSNLLKAYTRINNSKFKILIYHGRGMIVLNESFTPDWGARLIAKKGDAVIGTTSLPESKHVLVNGYSNGWLVDATDTELDYELVLYYKPQNKFNASLLVAGIAGTGIALFLLCSACRRRSLSNIKYKFIGAK